MILTSNSVFVSAGNFTYSFHVQFHLYFLIAVAKQEIHKQLFATMQKDDLAMSYMDYYKNSIFPSICPY